MKGKFKINGVVKAVFLSPFFWIIFAGLAVYFRSLFFGYTFDDGQLILNNRQYLGDWHNIYTAFTRNPYWNTNLSYYRPVLTLSFMADYVWAGINPFSFHLSNILFHLINCILVFILLTKLGLKRSLSFCWTLIFTVHPLFSQVVAWIPGRNDSLLSLFTLASWIMLIEYSQKKMAVFLAVQAVFLSLALLTKETAVLLPIMLLAYWLLIARERFLSKNTLTMLVVWGILLAIYSSVRWTIFGPSQMKLYGLKDCMIGLLSYAGKTLIPVNLSVMPVNIDVNIYYGLAVILSFIIAVVILHIKDKRLFWFGMAWTILFLVPTFVQVTDFPHFLEHRFYLPALGIPLFASQIKLGIAGSATWSKARSAVCLLIIILLAAVNFSYNKVFTDSRSFWKNAATGSPHNYFVHYMLGLVYYNQNDLESAETEFNRVLQIKPNSKWTYDNLAKIHERKGQIADAEEDYRQAVYLFPNDPVMHNNYGTFLLTQKRWEEAEKEFTTARDLIDQQTKPQDCSVIYYNLALLDVMNSRLENARDNLEKAVLYSKYDYKSLELLANVSFQLGDTPKAAEYYYRAMRHGLTPDKKVLEIIRSHLPQKGQD